MKSAYRLSSLERCFLASFKNGLSDRGKQLVEYLGIFPDRYRYVAKWKERFRRRVNSRGERAGRVFEHTAGGKRENGKKLKLKKK